VGNIYAPRSLYVDLDWKPMLPNVNDEVGGPGWVLLSCSLPETPMSISCRLIPMGNCCM
jgi:hypothetical protein